MPDENGVIARIKNVLHRVQDMDQNIVNELLLEGMAEVYEQLRKFRLDARNILDRGLEERKILSKRVDDIERIIYFPRNHPWLTGLIFTILFVAFNLWFVSGFRKAFLIWLDVPPEVIDILVPEAVIIITPHP